MRLGAVFLRGGIRVKVHAYGRDAAPRQPFGKFPGTAAVAIAGKAMTHGDQRHAAVIFLGKDRLRECIAAVAARQKEHLVYRCKAGAFYVPQKAFPKAARQTRGLQQQQSREQK